SAVVEGDREFVPRVAAGCVDRQPVETRVDVEIEPVFVTTVVEQAGLANEEARHRDQGGVVDLAVVTPVSAKRGGPTFVVRVAARNDGRHEPQNRTFIGTPSLTTRCDQLVSLSDHWPRGPGCNQLNSRYRLLTTDSCAGLIGRDPRTSIARRSVVTALA